MLPRTLSIVIAATTCLAAQTLTVPANAASRDGSGVLDAAGFEHGSRLQVLIGPSHLSSAVGSRLQALRLRRDGARFDLRPGRVSVTLTASASSGLDPTRPSAVFANNHVAPPVELFQGEVALPPAPALANRDGATWQAPDVVTIPFAAPFPYGGGTLCLQLDMVPVDGQASTWWPLDAERSGPAGQALTRGRPCGEAARFSSRPASVDTRTLRIGSTALFASLGVPHSAAVLIAPLRWARSTSDSPALPAAPSTCCRTY